jgi:DNA polymerase-4
MEWTKGARRAFALCKSVYLGVASLLRHRRRLRFAGGSPHLVQVKIEEGAAYSSSDMDQLRTALEGFTSAVDRESDGSFSLNFYGSPFLDENLAATLCRMQLEILKFTGMSTRIGAGRSKVLAELACNCKSDAGVQIVAAGSEKSFLDKLPVEMLAAGGNFKGLNLCHHGIGTIGELSRVPRAVLRAAFGLSVGDRLWMNSRGFDARPSAA